MNSTTIAIKKIKMLREINNYTQQYVANELDISQNAYSLIEKGLTKLTLDRLDQIALFYKINVIDLFMESGNPTMDNDPLKQFASSHSNIPPPITPLEKILYEKTIQHLESNITRLYTLIEQLASPPSSGSPSKSPRSENLDNFLAK